MEGYILLCLHTALICLLVFPALMVTEKRGLVAGMGLLAVVVAVSLCTIRTAVMDGVSVPATTQHAIPGIDIND